ncbi:hypothetical protein [Couchioplanes caeruleus]|uniref:Uncharacterized protein n=1 Tax=Couchioplanes caeruleus TaxID=56438 RepID=A0A3N1GTF1_9ACTN|nr:hypothetical protein [Couchioplanes caeruleus]ROP33488.1 hypothetical protein EDD30_6474 [Couchioplanes caeruleus]
MTHPPLTEPATVRPSAPSPRWAVLCLRVGTALLAASAIGLGVLTVML